MLVVSARTRPAAMLIPVLAVLRHWISLFSLKKSAGAHASRLLDLNSGADLNLVLHWMFHSTQSQSKFILV
jgi:hypothetical protein